jgi:hypothetical protein
VKSVADQNNRTMRKLRSDALWHTFTPGQQRKIQQWLFDGHFSYARTRGLMKSELGLCCALSTIGPMYHHLAELRANDALLTIQDAAGQVAEAGVDVEKLRSANEVLLATGMFTELQRSNDTKAIIALGKLAVQYKSRENQKARYDLLRRRLEASLKETGKTGLDRP